VHKGTDSMAYWAIVPVKPLRRGKSRLARVLSQDERYELNRSLLSHTLKTLADTPSIEHTLVVSRDPAAISLARGLGARTLLEDGNPELNLAITRATAVACSYGSCGVLVLPADLPLIQPEDIKSLLHQAVEPPFVVISPDRHDSGTNALFVRPAGNFKYQFGDHSFQKHCAQAQTANIHLVVYKCPAFALDVDTPEDLGMMTTALKLGLAEDYKAWQVKLLQES
jgi:2-phospho-L-lactate guanylyltransferase